MLHHIVLVKTKDGATQEQLEELCNNVKLLNSIPDVLAAYSGRNLLPTTITHGFNRYIYVQLYGQQSLKPYLENSIHRDSVTRYLHPIRLASVALDFGK